MNIFTYLFSDGYVDQFGGENGKKFMKKNFKNLILENQDKSMEEQKEIYAKTLHEWMNQRENGKSYEQIDDIIVLGVKI